MRTVLAACFAALIAVFPVTALADPTALIRGTATIAGTPHAGTTVTLVGEGTKLTTHTDAAGRFTFPRVAFGRYTITASAAGKPDASTTLSVESNAVVAVVLDIGALHVVGRTSTAAGRSAGDAPASVNALSRSQIADQPNNESLDRLIETMPGIVRFSYNEPVAHGFHGLSYEIDGVPLPVGTTSNFSEIIDPRTIDSLEVLTGAFPAEYGGSRQGAVVNIISQRANDLTSPETGSFTAGLGNYGSAEASLNDSFTAGNTRVSFDANTERTNRGLDSPTFDPVHDSASQGNQFLRTITNLSKLDSIAFDFSNNFATFQIPINPTANPNDPIVNPPSTDDVQREYDQFLNLAFTHNNASGTSYTQIAPWYRSDRVVYAGDLQNDIAATMGGVGAQLSGLDQDRTSSFAGIRLTQFQEIGPNAVKAGLDESVENFHGNEEILYFNADGTLAPPFYDNSAQKGSQTGAYIEDKWTPSSAFSLFGGLRYDHSTGYVSGGQLSPRLEANVRVDPNDIVHAYYGSLYAAPFLEDTRRAAVIVGGGALSGGLPTYDLQPEHDQYYEWGLAHTFGTSTRGYFNVWKRDVRNVLDTTQLANTPIFAVYNNTIGVAKGIEGRLDGRLPDGDSYFVSAQLSQSLAGGISGGTFLFPPSQVSDLTLQPEDHDQTFSAIYSYTHRFGGAHDFFATLAPQYGTGYPVQFQNGNGRLPDHFTLDASIGREANHNGNHGLGFDLTFQNLTNDIYLLKINNGFNTTQWAPGFQTTLRVTKAF